MTVFVAAFLDVMLIYGAPSLLALLGVWHIAFPVSIWKLGRLQAQMDGRATADAHTPAALLMIRVRGGVFIVGAVVFAIIAARSFG